MDAVAGFEILEHTADVGIRGWAPDVETLFAVMASGLFAIITDPVRLRGTMERRIRLEADSLPDLLHDWLEELNTLHQIHGELYAEFTPTVRDGVLEAVIRGEAIDPDRHELRLEVKAVTWHGLALEGTPGGYEAGVLLDI
jgi:SHS2 domain-containing protein